MQENRIYTGDAAVFMEKKMPADCVDITLTSPPYDELRKYGGQKSKFCYEKIIEGLFRVTKQNGVVVWVVADMIHKGGESGTSFKQALYFTEVGFTLYDTMIYRKQNPMPRKDRRYAQEFDYMFIFTKDGQPKTFNPIMVSSNYAGVKSTGKYYNTPDAKTPLQTRTKPKVISQTKVRGNIWSYWVGNNKQYAELPYASGIQCEHPAKMPLQLAIDHINTWSNPGDLVFDPMCGSGTSMVAAMYLGRNYIGIDVVGEYVRTARKRLRLAGDEFIESANRNVANLRKLLQGLENTHKNE